jgi:hypothetical protein
MNKEIDWDLFIGSQEIGCEEITNEEEWV